MVGWHLQSRGLGYESPVEVHHTQEPSELLYRRGLREIYDCINLFGMRFRSVLIHGIPEKSHFFLRRNAFTRIYEHPVLV